MSTSTGAAAAKALELLVPLLAVDPAERGGESSGFTGFFPAEVAGGFRGGGRTGFTTGLCPVTDEGLDANTGFTGTVVVVEDLVLFCSQSSESLRE
jgi:hypothetical protein